MNFPVADPQQQCTGLVLAGGRGLRMGGADKGLLPLHGRPLAAWALEVLQPQVRELLISANRNADQYAALGARVIADELPDYQGPLAGMLAALPHCATDWLLCVPCDMPGIPANLAQKLLASALLEQRDAAYAVIGGEPSYVCALLHRRLQASLTAFLAAGNRAVRLFLQSHDACAVNVAATRAPLNINRATDLQAASHG